jgi:hypothetical protein
MNSKISCKIIPEHIRVTQKTYGSHDDVLYKHSPPPSSGTTSFQLSYYKYCSWYPCFVF